jgi:RNA-directed DNA polymerase
MIPKPKPGTFRPISVPSYIDRCLQALYLLALDPIAEAKAAYDSFGFRKGRSPIWAAIRLSRLLNNAFVSIPYIIELDIEKCFDTINHKFIMENIPQIHPYILSQWLKSGYILAKHRNSSVNFEPTTVGVPQGGIISPTISNMVLDPLDPPRGKSRAAKVYTIRYADDTVILIPPNIDPDKVLAEKQAILAERGLKISPSKTRITPLHLKTKPQKFIFLGHEFLVLTKTKENGKIYQKCLFHPSPENVKRHKAKISSFLTNKTGVASAIARINPIITGFCNYYRFSNASKCFTNLSRWLYFKMANWLHKVKGWSVAKINKHLKEHCDSTHCPTPGGWFWYKGK